MIFKPAMSESKLLIGALGIELHKKGLKLYENISHQPKVEFYRHCLWIKTEDYFLYITGL